MVFSNYGEMKGKYFSWDYFDTMEKVRRAFNNLEDRFKFDYDDDY